MDRLLLNNEKTALPVWESAVSEKQQVYGTIATSVGVSGLEK